MRISQPSQFDWLIRLIPISLLVDQPVTLTTRGRIVMKHFVKGNFVAIPEKTLLSKKYRELSPSTRIVWEVMLLKYKRTGSEGRVKWKQGELADTAGLSERTVRDSLHILISKGLIRVWQPGGRWLDGTVYEMDSEWADGIGQST